MYQHRLLKIAEYVSLASSALGTVAAVATQQVAYSAAPLTVTLGLNIVNRQKLNSSTQEYLKQKADIQQIEKIKEGKKFLVPRRTFFGNSKVISL